MAIDLSTLTIQDWLEALNVLGVFSATGLAALSAKYARDSVLEQKRHDNPHVVIFVIQRQDSLNVLDLVVKNEGVRSALNLEFKVLGDDISVLTERKLSDISMIRNGISLLSGSEQIRHPMGIMLGEHFDEYKNANTVLTVSYQDEGGNSFQSSFQLGFKGLVDRKVGGKSELSKMTDALQDIHVEINKIKQDIHSVANNGIVPLMAQPYYTDDRFEVEDIKNKERRV